MVLLVFELFGWWVLMVMLFVLLFCAPLWFVLVLPLDTECEEAEIPLEASGTGMEMPVWSRQSIEEKRWSTSM